MAESRKTVTVVFADVTGSTALGERTDPETMRRIMERYFEEMRTVLERHGGTVEARSDGPGRGAEFVVRLPRYNGSPEPEEVEG